MIAEQHLALTSTFSQPQTTHNHNPPNEFVGEVFLRCSARDVVTRIGSTVTELVAATYPPSTILPDVKLSGHVDATFPYILSHLEYIIGELLRNSIQAVVESKRTTKHKGEIDVPPIEVTVCEAPQHVIIRVSDQGGGIPRDILPHLWSFSKGPRSSQRLQNLNQVPKMAATLQELKPPSDFETLSSSISQEEEKEGVHHSSLSSLSVRPPNLKLGMGLPLSRVYAEYWAGNLEVHSLEGYGVDAFLTISKLGNKNEQLTMRASMDGV